MNNLFMMRLHTTCGTENFLSYNNELRTKSLIGTQWCKYFDQIFGMHRDCLKKKIKIYLIRSTLNEKLVENE